MEKNPIEMIYDPDNAEPIVLFNEKNEPVSFEQIALIVLGDNDFAILAPVVPLEGMQEGEALAFQIMNENGEGWLEIVEDPDIVEQVFNEYYRLLEEEGVET